MNMLDILFVVIGSSLFLWLFYESIRTQQPFTNKQQGKPDQPIEYNLKIINLMNQPRLAGMRLLFSKWLMKTGIGELLSHATLRKMNLDQLRLCHLPDAPTLSPIPDWSPKPRSCIAVEFDKLVDPEESTGHSGKDSFKFVTISDLVKQYRLLSPIVPYRTRCGTTFLGSSPVTEDAAIVKKLRDGGAVIIGLSNMHELGIGVTGNNPNRLHGTPRNPYNVDHYTGGSSSGSAVAVASGLCPVAIGSDGGGSIRIPSAACGIVGVKASYGRVSAKGEFPLAPSVTCSGPLCATVRDAALVYAYVVGKDENDPKTLCQPDVTVEGFEDTSSLDGITLGIDWNYFKDCDPDVYKECEKAVQFLEDLGASVVSISIPELLVFLTQWVLSIMPKIPEISVGIQMERSVSVFQAMKQKTRAMNFLKAIFEDGVDCILTPALGIKVPKIPDDALENGEGDSSKVYKIFRYSGFANFTGIPAMTLPVGYDDGGLPIGLQIMTSWWNEQLMLRVAHAAEGFVTKKRPQVYYNLLE
ncbi:PREDICTED: fatty acid amide hydrolase-like [Acropora digitifera]|uniref:fatty acid amide hydrolase-like n=1 Tax=Acropora digitifera TaxID=70779 RepID=UPI00077B05D4|nr:PREDICTED: fatty acid amide hydrolase-like [Acropora digitifera]